MLRTDLGTLRVALTCIAYVCFGISDSNNFLRTFVCTCFTADAQIMIYFNMISNPDSIYRTCFSAESSEDAEVIRIFKITVIIIRFDSYSCFWRHVFTFFVSRANLCTKLAAYAVHFIELKSFHLRSPFQNKKSKKNNKVKPPQHKNCGTVLLCTMAGDKIALITLTFSPAASVMWKSEYQIVILILYLMQL